MQETQKQPEQSTPAEEEAKQPEQQPQQEEKKASSKIPSEERLLSAIAYIPPAFILPLITKPSSKYCQFHAKQGLGMFVVDFVVLFILAIIPMIGSLLFLAAIAVSAIAIFQAYQGEKWEIPALGKVMKNVDLSKFVESGKTKEKPKQEEQQAPEEQAEDTKEQASEQQSEEPKQQTQEEEEEEETKKQQPPQQKQ